ncbi:MAG: hypothetical protein ACYC27_01960 [Armatimonadota bacterium]
MRRILITSVAVILMLSAFATFAVAFTMSEKVVVANELVAIARVPAGGFSAQERIDRINERLAYILGNEPLAPRDIRAVRMRGSMAIMVGSELLMTVTSQDAKANNTTITGLTQIWLDQARAAIPQARPTPSIPG